MEKSALHYMAEGFLVLKANVSYVLIPFILSLGFYLSDFVIEELRPLFTFLVTIILFIVFPLFYGQFAEIIKYGKKDTWLKVFNNYWVKVVLLSLILKGPIIILDLVVPQIVVLNVTVSFIIDIASIYILPLVLLEKKIFNSIYLGIICLLGNLKFSLPLIIVTTFPLLIPFLFGMPLKYINIKFLLLPFSIVLVLLIIIFEFTVFITASIILKDKLYVS